MISNEIKKYIDNQIKTALAKTKQTKVNFTLPLVNEGVVGDVRFAYVKNRLNICIKGLYSWEIYAFTNVIRNTDDRDYLAMDRKGVKTYIYPTVTGTGIKPSHKEPT